MTDNNKKIIEEFREKFTYLRDYSEQEHGLRGVYIELNPDEVESFFLEKLQEEREKMIEAVRNLLDEYNEMDDNAIQFELRIRKPVEFAKRLNKLKSEEEKV